MGCKSKKYLHIHDWNYWWGYFRCGKGWEPLGDALQMAFDWPDFVGQRFGLFYYSTQQTGGCADFDFFRVDKEIIVK